MVSVSLHTVEVMHLQSGSTLSAKDLPLRCLGWLLWQGSHLGHTAQSSLLT